MLNPSIRRSLVALVGLAAVGLATAACSSSSEPSDEDEDDGGNGGSSGGQSGGSGGKSGGSGGQSGGSGGQASGTGGGSGAPDNGCDDLKPKTGTLAGTMALPNVLLAEVAPGEGVVLYNTTNADIELTDENFFLCAQFQYSKAAKELAGGATKIPARGYLKLNWPTEFTLSKTEGGEVVLYRDASFFSASSVLDYVCWGNLPTGNQSRKTNTAGGRNEFTGDCAPAPTNGTILRKPDTAGETKDDYDATAEKKLKSCPE
ncbi:MAG: hypothetical protein KA712_03485 [Myxococcales bacterium]|nr:hypothetical protein [Myxococcales bacterium]